MKRTKKTARPLAAPLQMAKHPQFKIIKKKMHKRPKKVSWCGGYEKERERESRSWERREGGREGPLA
jgi:hypothetical protein